LRNGIDYIITEEERNKIADTVQNGRSFQFQGDIIPISDFGGIYREDKIKPRDIVKGINRCYLCGTVLVKGEHCGCAITKKAQELTQEIIDYWNSKRSLDDIGRAHHNVSNKDAILKKAGVLPNYKNVNGELERVINSLLKQEYTKANLTRAIDHYIEEIINRQPNTDYSIHRFSLDEFLKYKFKQFLNK
jgi:hypothetical protein